MPRDMRKSTLGSTVTRADIAQAVHRTVGISKSEAATMVDVFFQEMSDAAARGENLKLSSFGTFAIRAKRQRIGRNPKTGAEVPITPRRVMTFKPSNILKQRINRLPAGRDE